jgi:hypothetical protein
MRETLLDLMIRFNEGNMLDPWNENEEELGDLDDLLGSYRRGTLGSYQGGSMTSTPGGGSSGTVPGVKFVRDAPGGGWVGNYQGQEWTYNSPKPGNQTQPGAGGGFGGGLATNTGATSTGGGFGGVGGGGGGAGSPEDIAGTLADYGEGLMEPGSDLSQRWMEQMREDVGKGTDAAQRAAGYQAVQSGFGGGASPELLQSQTDIGIAGQEAAGDAASDYLLRAPELGIGAVTGALGPLTSMRGQDLTSKIASESNVLSREGMAMGDARSQRELDEDTRRRDEDRARDEERYQEELRRRDLANELVQQGSTGGNTQVYQPWGGFSLGVN